MSMICTLLSKGAATRAYVVESNVKVVIEFEPYSLS